MQAAAKPSYSASGALVNGGTDLDMEGGMSDYFKDIIMVSPGLSLADHVWWENVKSVLTAHFLFEKDIRDMDLVSQFVLFHQNSLNTFVPFLTPSPVPSL